MDIAGAGLMGWLPCLGLGLLSGFLAGLLGIGGGLIIVPGLVLIFLAQGYDPSITTHLAVGTSLACIVLTSLSSLRTHHRRGAVDWRVWRQLVPALLVGGLIGAVIAGALPARTLQWIIGVFAVWTGLRMVRRTPVHRIAPVAPIGWRRAAAGTAMGAASAVFGIGGGSLMVPYLTRYGMVMQRAVGTAAAAGLPIALAGALGFLWQGWGVAALPTATWGYLHPTALLLLSLSSVVSAYGGAVLAHRLPAARLKQIFGGVLMLVGLRFLWGF